MQKAGILVLILIVAVGLVFPGLGVGSSSEEDLCIPMGVIDIGPPEEFASALAGLTGRVRVDRGTAPVAVSELL